MGRIFWVWANVLLATFAFTSQCSPGLEGPATKDLPPPTNIRATLEEDFVVTWTWDPPENLNSENNCSVAYITYFNDKKECGPANVRNDTPQNCNNEMCFEVKSICEGGRQSNEVRQCTFLLKGDNKTYVTDFSCTCYEDEPMECTWHLEKSAPPDTNYTLIYRYKNKNERCPAYTYEKGVVNGCRFVLCDIYDTVNILITDPSMKLGRFYTSEEPYKKRKPRPLSISVSKSSIDSIYVQWNDTNVDKKVYQVRSKNSKSQNWKEYNISKRTSFSIDSAHRNAMYTVQVRSIFDRNAGGKLWSDWSREESIGEHIDDWTLHYSLLRIIPLILAIAIATILLLVFWKRLQIKMFPPIPDPGKIFRTMFAEEDGEMQHWIKHGTDNFPNEPVKEETCSVFLVENETSLETS